MSQLIDLLQKYRNITLQNEDGEKTRIEFYEGSNGSLINDFEHRQNIKLPDDLRSLLMFSNGLRFFGIRILPLEEIQCSNWGKNFVFHEWGNGDFDCIDQSNFLSFMFQNEDKLIGLELSLRDWFENVFIEIKNKGSLLHPLDYDYRAEDGFYKIVWKKIKDLA